MLREPDPQLAVEQTAMPEYAPSQPPLSPAALKALQGCLLALWQLLRSWLSILLRLLEALLGAPQDRQEGQAQLAKERVGVLLPPPPTISGLLTAFRDADTVKTSRDALQAYREEHRAHLAAPEYPLRVRVARHTGLPAFLTGFLSDREADLPRDDAEAYKEMASHWLFGDLQRKALFGKRLDEQALRYDSIQVHGGTKSKGRLQFETSTTGTQHYSQKVRVQEMPTAHVRYQQWYQSADGAEWPVFGGDVVVHLKVGSPKVSVTNSYFPGPPPDTTFSRQLSAEQAKLMAEQVLAAYLDASDTVGFYWRWLEDLVAARASETAPELATQAMCDRVLREFLLALAEYSEQQGLDIPDLQEWLAMDVHCEAELLGEVRGHWLEFAQGGDLTWDVRVVSHAGSEDEELPWLLPFAGQYYVAYQVMCLSPSGDQAWRIFVDAVSGQVLGHPENSILYGVNIYHSSGDARSDTEKVSNAFQDLQDLTTTVSHLMQLRSTDVTQYPREIANIAFHAYRLLQHFASTCGADALLPYLGSTETPFLSARVEAGPDFRMCFNPATLGAKLIRFQTGAGLQLSADWENKTVDNPSWDPEVIYHEVTHGLMWKLNPKPFEHLQDENVPFGRALLEGYANYFARSLGAQGDPDGQERWARAAYSNWGTRWALSRSDAIAGEDILPAPNLYPHNQTDPNGPEVYNVSMVWARALWDVREILGYDPADRLALKAFECVHGWVANFETAAEGLIAAARQSNLPEGTVDQIINTFAQRSILAERGVQALVHFQDTGGQKNFLVGTDAGVRRFLYQAGTGSLTESTNGWNLSENEGVVALVYDSARNTVYAATEGGVYQRPINTNTWSALGAWPEEEAPLSMVMDAGKLYVGTAGKVWLGDPATGNWQQWGGEVETLSAETPSNIPGGLPVASSGPEQPLAGSAGVALDLAAGVTNGDRYVYAANMMTPRYRGINVAGFNRWIETPGIGGDGIKPLSTAVAVNGGFVCAGTLAHGIWRRRLGAPLTEGWSRVDVGQKVEGAVLALKTRGTDLYAGTTAGLFKGTPQGQNWIWTHEPIGGGTTAPIITAVLPADGKLLVGTATGELWFHDGNTWSKVG
ncbi:MAG: hypothetical protein SWK90_00515 [Chloroflexota bacterium]|nr:hypothetical protein [Chloroflexota bacterium]